MRALNSHPPSVRRRNHSAGNRLGRVLYVLAAVTIRSMVARSSKHPHAPRAACVELEEVAASGPPSCATSRFCLIFMACFFAWGIVDTVSGGVAGEEVGALETEATESRRKNNSLFTTRGRRK